VTLFHDVHPLNSYSEYDIYLPGKFCHFVPAFTASSLVFTWFTCFLPWLQFRPIQVVTCEVCYFLYVMLCCPLDVQWWYRETSVDFCWTTQCYIPENTALHSHHCGSLKSSTVAYDFPNVVYHICSGLKVWICRKVPYAASLGLSCFAVGCSFQRKSQLCYMQRKNLLR
jgi:hypothetical protein